MGKRASKQAKEKLKKGYRKFIPHFELWQLILILIPLLFITASSLRYDHARMEEIKKSVLKADESGDTAETKTKLKELREYTLTHIIFNTSSENGDEKIIFGTGPIMLTGQYQRDAEAALEKAKQAAAASSVNNPNGNIYQKAADVCDKLGIQNHWRYPDRPYIDCFQSELQRYPATEDSSTFIQASIPDKSLYRYEYNSPYWTPSLSGFLILASLILTVIVVIKFVIWLFLAVALLATRNK